MCHRRISATQRPDRAGMILFPKSTVCVTENAENGNQPVCVTGGTRGNPGVCHPRKTRVTRGRPVEENGRRLRCVTRGRNVIASSKRPASVAEWLALLRKRLLLKPLPSKMEVTGAEDRDAGGNQLERRLPGKTETEANMAPYGPMLRLFYIHASGLHRSDKSPRHESADK